MATSTITPKQVRSWASRYRKGESLPAIAESVGVNMTTVRAHLLKAGIPMRSPGRRSTVTKTQLRSWTRAYQRGDSFAAIGRAAGCAPGTVRSHLTKAGVIGSTEPAPAAPVTQPSKPLKASRTPKASTATRRTATSDTGAAPKRRRVTAAAPPKRQPKAATVAVTATTSKKQTTRLTRKKSSV